MIPAGYRVLPMAGTDLDEVADLERRLFATPWARDAFRHEVRDNPHSRNYVVRAPSHELAAYACAYVIEDELLINNLAVAPAHRARGLGRGLVMHLLEIGRAANCRSALLEVRPSNRPARRLYRRLGFRRQRVRPRYYGDGEDAWVLGRAL